jgi:T5SS/PEP-CTERM-associated repeat protein
MGAGALWGNSDDLYVGKSGQADLTISNAGQVGCSNSYIAQEAGSTATIRVLDPNSRWTVTNYIEVGGLGSANLEVSNGGRIQNLNTQVARQPGSEAIIHVTAPAPSGRRRFWLWGTRGMSPS